jgi:CSLREA domain-containing protein
MRSPTTIARTHLPIPAAGLAAACLGVLACQGVEGLAPPGDPESAAIPQAALIVPTVTLTVNSTNDVEDGSCDATHCSLRDAIRAGNAVNDFPTVRQVGIHFAIPESSTLECTPPPLVRCVVHKFVPAIQLTADLPAITRAIAIDGSTQPGFNGTPLVEVRGPATGQHNGFFLQTNDGGGLGGSVIRGLAITGFSRAGIFIDSTQSFIAGNFIGLTPSGAARPNGNGIVIRGEKNTVGGLTSGDRNVISGNTGAGVIVCRGCFLAGSGTAGNNVVQGNFIGTTVAGTAARGNQEGILIVGDGFLGAPANSYVGPVGNLIGGATAARGNVISGNRGAGVRLSTGASSTELRANVIGLNAAGTAAVPNGAEGVAVREAVGSLLAHNTISGNTGDGVRMSNDTSDPHPTRTTLLGNVIGADPAGLTDLGNVGSGVKVTRFALASVQVGATDEGNTIAFNGGVGVGSEASSAGSLLDVRFNRIFSNDGMGIDLSSDGVSSAGLPTVLAVTHKTTTTKFDGSFDFPGLPGRDFAIDVYSSHLCDDSGFGEGQVFLGSIAVSTPASSTSGTFSVELPVVVAVGERVTAISRQVSANPADLSGTSEFSQCTTVTN